ncbi:MAG: hypothetical protein V1770_02300 [bacterium]
MSHVSSEKIGGFEKVNPVVLGEGIKVAAQMLALEGIAVTDFFYNFGGEKCSEFEGMKVICGIGTEGAVKSRKFGGMGLAVDKNGKLAIIGDFYYSEQKQRKAELQKKLEQVLGGACYFAARALVARAKGQTTEVVIHPETHKLQLVVEF